MYSTQLDAPKTHTNMEKMAARSCITLIQLAIIHPFFELLIHNTLCPSPHIHVEDFKKLSQLVGTVALYA